MRRGNSGTKYTGSHKNGGYRDDPALEAVLAAEKRGAAPAPATSFRSYSPIIAPLPTDVAALFAKLAPRNGRRHHQLQLITHAP